MAFGQLDMKKGIENKMGHITQVKELLNREKEILCFRNLCDCLTCVEPDCHLPGAPEFLNSETARKGLSQPEAENVHGMNSEPILDRIRHG
jgi:hypothetical protein